MDYIHTFITKNYEKYKIEKVKGLGAISKTIYDLIITEQYQQLNYNNKQLVIDNVFKYYLYKDTNQITKEYKKYYNNKDLINYIIQKTQPKENELILDGNANINSFTSNILSNNIYLYQPNEKVKDILETEIKTIKPDININYINHNVLEKGLIKNNFDLIYFNLENDFRNIIHANCCEQVKKLKLRGTKSEPLLLQLIITSLAKYGRAAILVPNSFLYCDSNQHIQTREHLLNKCLLESVVEIQYNKTDSSENEGSINSHKKTSILFFKNGNKTEIVKFMSIDLCDKIIEKLEFEKSYNEIMQNKFSLYNKDYIETNKIKNDIEFIKFTDLFAIYTEEIGKKDKIFGINKTVNDNEDISIIIESKQYPKYLNTNEYQCFYYEKANTRIVSSYGIYYINYLLNNKETKNKFIKGKMNNVVLEIIEDINIPILDEAIQNTVIKHNLYKKNIIEQNDNNIKLNNYIIKMLFVPLKNEIEERLENIVNLHIGKELNKDKEYIGVVKNGLSVGRVYLLNNSNPSFNSYYLSIKNDNYDIKFIYYYLRNYQFKLEELGKLGKQPQLSQSSLLNMKIPNINKKIQENIINTCMFFDKNINIIKEQSEKLLEYNLLNFINLVIS